jgi:hypothetical protein
MSTATSSASRADSTAQTGHEFALALLGGFDIHRIPEPDRPRALACLGALRHEYIHQNKGKREMDRITALSRNINALIIPAPPKEPDPVPPPRPAGKKKKKKSRVNFRVFLDKWIGQKPGFPCVSAAALTPAKEPRERLRLVSTRRTPSSTRSPRSRGSPMAREEPAVAADDPQEQSEVPDSETPAPEKPPAVAADEDGPVKLRKRRSVGGSFD